MKNSFIPAEEAGRDAWLTNFASKLPQYAAKYGILTADVADMTASAASYRYYLNYHSEYEKFVRKLTAFKKELANGLKANLGSSVMPTPPTLPTTPTAVASGVFKRASSIAQHIKKHISFTEADGHDLALIGTEQTTDLNTAQPTLTFKLVQGGMPELHFVRGQFQAVRIFTDTTGSGNWQFLTQVAHSTIDKSPLPLAGQSAVRLYRAIYIYKDEPVGVYSSALQVTVTGTI